MSVEIKKDITTVQVEVPKINVAVENAVTNITVQTSQPTITISEVGVSGRDGTNGTSGTSPVSPFPYNVGLFSQTAATNTVTGTTEQTILDGGVGTLTVGANGFAVGDSYTATFGGLITNTNNRTIRIRIKSGTTLLADSGVVSLAGNSNSTFRMDIDFTIRAIGGAGVASLYTFGTFQTSKPANASLEGFGFQTLNNTTFDTTASNTLNVTAQWGNNGDSITVQMFRLTKNY